MAGTHARTHPELRRENEHFPFRRQVLVEGVDFRVVQLCSFLCGLRLHRKQDVADPKNTGTRVRGVGPAAQSQTPGG